jgi:hypothetical protein
LAAAAERRLAPSLDVEDPRTELWREQRLSSVSDDLQSALKKLRLDSPSRLDAMLGDYNDEERMIALAEILSMNAVDIGDEEIGNFFELVDSATLEAKGFHRRWASKGEWSFAAERLEQESRASAKRPRDEQEEDVMRGRQLPRRPQFAKWASRGARARLCPTAEARKEREEEERARMVQKLVDLIRRADLPLARRAAQSLDPERALLRCAGKARAGTIRGRIREVERCLDWYQVQEPGIAWPRHEFVVADFLEERAAEPCGRSIPQSLLNGFAFVEEAGGVPVEDRISRTPHLLKTVEDLTSHLAAATGLKARKKARLLPVMLIRAWELLVTSNRPEVPPYARALAWVRLLKLWTAMRFDDTRGLLPATMALASRGLDGTLARTKTTGAGRKVEAKQIWVAHDAHLADPKWLATGFLLWKSAPFNFARDYMLPLPNKDYSGTVAREALYIEAAALSRWLWTQLKVPALTDGVWGETNQDLFEVNVGGFFTEHSERNWLDSWSASLGYSREERERLGWSAESTEEYVRSSRVIIERLQMDVASKIRGNGTGDLADEAKVIDEMKVFLVAKGSGPKTASAQAEALRTFGKPEPRLTMSVKEAALEDVDEQISQALDDPNLEPIDSASETKEVIMALVDPEPLPATSVAINVDDALSSEEEVQLPPPGLVIAITGGRRQLRRLHRWKLTGGCNRVPGLDYRLYECVPKNDLDKAEYDDWCHSCWRKGTTPEETAVEDDAGHVDSSANSTSGDNSPSSDDPTASDEESSSEEAAEEVLGGVGSSTDDLQAGSTPPETSHS